MSLAKTQNIILQSSAIGYFSKREVANLIVSGSRHVHSTELGIKDPLANLTYQSIENKTTTQYPWETKDKIEKLYLTASYQRKRLTLQVLDSLKIKPSSSFGNKIFTALEELFTNSIYHAYKKSDGGDKYDRKSPVDLAPNEKITVEFFRNQSGVFTSIRDFGAGLSFAALQSYFNRCYNNPTAQIENKVGGAGLGLYVVFELTTHLKIVCYPNHGTLVNCWFASPSAFEPKYFSFNFFEEEKVK